MFFPHMCWRILDANFAADFLRLDNSILNCFLNFIWIRDFYQWIFFENQKCLFFSSFSQILNFHAFLLCFYYKIKISTKKSSWKHVRSEKKTYTILANQWSNSKFMNIKWQTTPFNFRCEQYFMCNQKKKRNLNLNFNKFFLNQFYGL